MKCSKNIIATTALTECMFLCICRGVYDIVVKTDCVGQYNNKGSFGELALMYNTPRAATIIATEAGALWGLVSVCVKEHAIPCGQSAL